MSKKIVEHGVSCFLKGDILETYSSLSKLEINFLRKRLIILFKEGKIDSNQATTIWNISFPHLKNRLFTGKDFEEKQVKTKNLQLQDLFIDKKIFAPPPTSRRINLNFPFEFLDWLKINTENVISIDDFDMTQPWGLAAIAALARKERENPLKVDLIGTSSPGRFAFAIGMNELINNKFESLKIKDGRTVKMQRVNNFAKIEPIAYEISHLLIDKNILKNDKSIFFDEEETRRTIYYVIVELLRNVVQHSFDNLGGVVVAQKMNTNLSEEKDKYIQIAVVDNGIGIFKALNSMHEEIITPELALERSLWPYFSGAFDKTKKGTSQNAGLGLFFVSEMAKLTGGKLFIASRGASLLLVGDPNGEVRGDVLEILTFDTLLSG
jgi:anti-sigma regulatory factor (Ser/Thr protein kinase)